MTSDSSIPFAKYDKFNFILNFYAIPESIKIANLEPYNQGFLYGIDLSSASVVLALNPQYNENILDLCCCPGAKLLFIGDMMESFKVKITGSLTGVDINSKRLNICESLCKKYCLDWIKLKVCDGVAYKGENLYDKVLVDAECTHDGSLKHLKKYLPEFNIKHKIKIEEDEKEDSKEKEETMLSNKEKKRRKKQEELKKNDNKYISDKNKKNEWTMEDFKERVLDKKKLQEITNLQMNLLRNAFHLVKPGGTIIYSTCSFIKAQNEDIVFNLCEEEKGKVELVEVFPEEIKKELKCVEGFLKKTVRFDPITSKSGGMFIAALKKIE
jgi:16S rRNA C967 or C1407 C5-methylase (RsmB/RsmF family)